MDDYSLLGIFESLDFGDLANVAVLSPRLQQLIERYFIASKYGQAEIYFSISEKAKDTHTFYEAAGEKPRHIKLASGHVAMFSTMQAFCHLFDRIILHVYDIFDTNFIRDIAYNVNRHCSNTTLEIGMTLNRQSVDFQFEYATIVKLNSLEPENIAALEKYFPKMEELRIFVTEAFIFNQNVPGLKRFELREQQFGLFDLRAFGEHNSQLRGIKLTIPWHLELLGQVNELFPNLESLDLRFIEADYVPPNNWLSMWSGLKSIIGLAPKPVEMVRFRNVRHVTMDIRVWYKKPQQFHIVEYDEWARDVLPKIQYEQLQSYTLITRNSEFSILHQIDLIAQNQGLTSVDIRYTLTYDQMIRLIDALPKLEVLKLECRSTGMAVDILRLMTRETSLDTILVYADSRRMNVFLGMISMPGDWYLHEHFKKKRFLYKRSIGVSKRSVSSVIGSK